MENNSILNSEFSYYPKPITNTFPSKTITLLELIKLIKSKVYANETESLRKLKGKDQSKFKRYNFNYVTFSGVFSKRNIANLMKHSGLIVIDIDHVENAEKIKNELLLKCPYFIFAFTSPSGFGVKVVYRVDIEKHTQYEWYKGYSKYLIDLLELPAQNIDESGSDVSRACFLPCDEKIVVNPKIQMS